MYEFLSGLAIIVGATLSAIAIVVYAIWAILDD